MNKTNRNYQNYLFNSILFFYPLQPFSIAQTKAEKTLSRIKDLYYHYRYELSYVIIFDIILWLDCSALPAINLKVYVVCKLKEKVAPLPSTLFLAHIFPP